MQSNSYSLGMFHVHYLLVAFDVSAYELLGFLADAEHFVHGSELSVSL